MKYWRGTRSIASSTRSSRMPCSRRRSSMRSAARPPAWAGSRTPISDLEPLRDGIDLTIVGQIDAQRRDRNITFLDGLEIRPLPRVRCLAGRSDPVHRLAARRGAADDRLGLVALAQAREPHAADIASTAVRDVDVE